MQCNLVSNTTKIKDNVHRLYHKVNVVLLKARPFEPQ